MSTLDARKNFAIVTAITAYDDAAVTITLVSGDGAKLPQPSTDGAFNLTWWNATGYNSPADDPDVEIVRCTARTGDVITIVRAQEGTTATAKDIVEQTYKLHLGPTAKTITDIETVLDSKEDAANKGVADGYASLDGDGLVPVAQLPAISITNTFVVTSQAEMLALTAQTGDVAVRTDTNTTYILRGSDPTVLADWELLRTPTDSVLSVNGMTGAVEVTLADISARSTDATKSKYSMTSNTDVLFTDSSGNPFLRLLEQYRQAQFTNDGSLPQLSLHAEDGIDSGVVKISATTPGGLLFTPSGGYIEENATLISHRYDTDNYFNTGIDSNANVSFGLTASSGTPKFSFNNKVNFLAGVSADVIDTEELNVDSTYDVITGSDKFGMETSFTVTSSSPVAGLNTIAAGYSELTYTGGDFTDYTGLGLIGSYGFVAGASSGTVDQMIGTTGLSYLVSGTNTKAYGTVGVVLGAGSGTTTHAIGLGAQILNYGANVFTNAYGLKVEDITVGGTNYAIKTGSGLVDFGDATSITKAGTQLSLKYDSSNKLDISVALNADTTFALTALSGTPKFQFDNPVNIGIATATAAQLTVLGGQSGQPIISLVRTSGATVQFDWALAGGGLSFGTNGRVVTNIFGNSTENEFYVGQKLTILAGQNTRDSIIGGTTIGSGYGSNTSVANLIIQGNLGNGNGTSGDILLKTGNTGSSGTTTHTSSTRVTIKNNTGNVGIGTTSPSYKIDVNGNYSFNRPSSLVDTGSGIFGVQGSSTNGVLFVPSDLSTNNGYFKLSFPDATSVRFNTDYDGHLPGGFQRDIQFGNNSTVNMVIKGTGNIGIGTTPTHRLDSYLSSSSTGVSSICGLRDIPSGTISSGSSINGVLGQLTVSGSTTISTITATGGNFIAEHTGSSTVHELVGLRGWARTNGASTGVLASAKSILASAPANSQAGNTITNAYSLYIESPTVGTTLNYSLFQTGTAMNRLGGSLGIGADPVASAILQADSTSKGFLPPRMTTAQKNAIGTPATGLVLFDTDLAKLCVYTGAGWETITSS